MKKFFILIELFTFNSFANDSLNRIYNLSNDTMEIVTHTKEFPRDGHFNLTSQEADLAMTLGRNDYLIGNYASAIASPVWDNLNCQKNKSDLFNISK